jgi:hypothetical protein
MKNDFVLSPLKWREGLFALLSTSHATPPAGGFHSGRELS